MSHRLINAHQVGTLTFHLQELNEMVQETRMAIARMPVVVDMQPAYDPPT
jgi:uncharacterized coiled-coil protein SlyX